MKVKLISAIAGDRFSYRPREVIECSKRAGAQLIAGGAAIEAASGAEVDGRLPEGKAAASDAPTPKREPEKATVAPSESAVTSGAPAHCKGTTGKGHPCKKAPAAGAEYCANHQGSA